MFSVNEKVVYPGHGVAIVSQAIEKSVAGHKVCFFELTFLSKDMTILVPVKSLTGIRRLSSVKKIDDVFNMLSQPTTKDIHELTASNWNKRNKDYQFRLRSGSLDEIGHVYRDLKFIATQKELSFGEKNLLHQTESLLAQEIAIVKQINEDKAIELLRSFFTMHKNNVIMHSKQTVATVI
ncbi:MAG: CarD family transcriptional regulator [Candidatus Dependentiae bacterium]